MGLTISNGDPRAAIITGAGLTAGFFSGMDADATNGAQTIASVFDREGTTLFRIVRGTGGTTNLVLKDDAGVDWFVVVSAAGVLSANAAAVA